MNRRRVLVAGGVALTATIALFALRYALHTPALQKLAQPSPGSYSGSWYFPRGGPYLLGFSSPSDAVLSVDGKIVARGTGEQSGRVVFAPGVYDVTFLTRAESARLLWHPPGRRGALEYVPASSLSAEPAARAHFGAGAGASHLDAAVLTLILLVWMFAAFYIGRPQVDRRWLIALASVFIGALLVRLWVVAAFGQTWDEDEYWSAGRNYLENILDLDFSAYAWRFNYEHPPLTKYIAGLGALWTDGYGGARLLFALIGAGTCALATDLGRRLFDTRAGMVAGVILALFPRLIAHDVVVGHETPSVFFWTLAVWFSVRAGQDLDLWLRNLVYASLALGLAASTRFANLLVGPVLAVTLLTLWPVHTWWRRGLVAGLVGPLVAALVLFALWPRMWVAPLAHLQSAWQVLKEQNMPEYYLGQLVSHPPWHYFPVYLLATTPVLVL